MFSESELTGQTRRHVVQNDELHCAMHPVAMAAFLRLRAAARDAGFDLRPLSSFRDLESQLRIWNNKCLGKRPVLGADGEVLKRDDFSEDDYVDAILQWSALPGASRHHWGTDVDVYDGARVSSRSDVQLVPSEFAADGVFCDLHLWLSQNMADFDFFRPYQTNRGGVRPEPWHLSFAPLSSEALGLLTQDLLLRTFGSLKMQCKDVVVRKLPEFFNRYVVHIDLCPEGP